jgi:hypothetical protein
MPILPEFVRQCEYCSRRYRFPPVLPFSSATREVGLSFCTSSLERKGNLPSLCSAYLPLVIVLAAMIVAGLSLEDTNKIFGRKLCLSPKQSVKRRQLLWVIRKVVFAI